jgi:hypothetical protein
MRAEMRTLALISLSLFVALPLRAADTCTTIHGRARSYCGDGQLRIWHVGTHHEYEPDETSWQRVEGWLEAGGKDTKDSACGSATTVDLFADYLICPVEPFKAGSVQKAKFISAQHRRYVPVS